MLSRFHIWIGILAAIPWALQGLGGALLVFEPELDALLNRSLFFVEPADHRLDLDGQFAVVERERPDLAEHVYAMDIRERPGRATQMLAKPGGEIGPRDGVRIFVDPYRGELLGVQGYRDSFMGKIYHFHRTFYLPRWGRWITSTSAILLMASVVAGFVLFFVKRSSRKGRGRLYRWHARFGVICAPLVFLIALNGTIITYRFIVVPLIYKSTGREMPVRMKRQEKIEPPTPDAERITLMEALAIAERTVPDATHGLLTEPADPNHPIMISRRKPGEPRDIGGTFINIHPYTGEVLAVSDYTEGQLADRMVYATIHLHTGEWGGYFGETAKLTTRILWVVAALSVPVLAVAGVASLAARRRGLGGREHAEQELPEAV